MPNPTRSSATVVQIVPNPAGSGLRSPPLLALACTSDGRACRSRCPPRPSRRLGAGRGSRRRGEVLRAARRVAFRGECSHGGGHVVHVALQLEPHRLADRVDGSREGARRREVTRVERGVHLADAVEQQRHRSRGVEVVVHGDAEALDRRGIRGMEARELDCDAPRERIETGEGSLGAVSRVLADLERRAVVRLQHEQPVGAGIDGLDEVEEVREVAERLRHLLAAHLDQAVVHPVRANSRPSATACARSFSWCGNARSRPPPWRSNRRRGGRVTSRRTRCASPDGPRPTATPTTARPASPASRARSRRDHASLRRRASLTAAGPHVSSDWCASRP